MSFCAACLSNVHYLMRAKSAAQWNESTGSLWILKGWQQSQRDPLTALFKNKRPASSVKTAEGKTKNRQSIDMMGKKRGAWKQHHSRFVKTRATAKTSSDKHGLSIQPNGELCRVEFKERQKKLGISSRFEWYCKKPCSGCCCCISSFFFSLELPPPERADKSWVFVLGWGNDWARGQTSKTDENKRLSGGPLKRKLLRRDWDVHVLPLWEQMGSEWECVCRSTVCAGGWEVSVYCRWYDCQSHIRASALISPLSLKNIRLRSDTHTNIFLWHSFLRY